MESITIYCYEIRPPVLIQVKATINGTPMIPPHCNVRRHPWSCSCSGYKPAGVYAETQIILYCYMLLRILPVKYMVSYM